MAKKRSTGMSRRVGFLDRDTVREDREIMAYNRQLEREDRAIARRAQEEERRASARAELTGGIVADGALGDGLEALTDALTDGVRFPEASVAGWRALLAAGPEDVEASREEWAVALHVVATRLHERGVRVPGSALRAPRAPSPLRRELVAAGRAAEDSKVVSAALERFVDLLLDGERIRTASARAWRTVRVAEAERQRAGRAWSRATRAVSEVWARDHDDVLPSEADERAERTRVRAERLTAELTRAGEAVESWPVFAYEGEQLVALLAHGTPLRDALGAAQGVLEERAARVSPQEWGVVRAEWSKITDAVSARLLELGRQRG